MKNFGVLLLVVLLLIITACLSTPSPSFSESISQNDTQSIVPNNDQKTQKNDVESSFVEPEAIIAEEINEMNNDTPVEVPVEEVLESISSNDELSTSEDQNPEEIIVIDEAPGNFLIESSEEISVAVEQKLAENTIIDVESEPEILSQVSGKTTIVDEEPFDDLTPIAERLVTQELTEDSAPGVEKFEEEIKSLPVDSTAESSILTTISLADENQDSSLDNFGKEELPAADYSESMSVVSKNAESELEILPVVIDEISTTDEELHKETISLTEDPVAQGTTKGIAPGVEKFEEAVEPGDSTEIADETIIEELETPSPAESTDFITNKNIEETEVGDIVETIDERGESSEPNIPEELVTENIEPKTSDLIIETSNTDKSDMNMIQAKSVENIQPEVKEATNDLKTVDELKLAASQSEDIEVISTSSEEVLTDPIVSTALPLLIELGSIEEPMLRRTLRRPFLLAVISGVVVFLVILGYLLLIYLKPEFFRKLLLKIFAIVQPKYNSFLKLLRIRKFLIKDNVIKQKSLPLPPQDSSKYEQPINGKKSEGTLEIQEAELKENCKDVVTPRESSKSPIYVETEEILTQENPYHYQVELVATILDMYTMILDSQLLRPLGDIDQFILDIFDLDKKTSSLLRSSKKELHKEKVDYHRIMKKYLEILPKADTRKIVMICLLIVAFEGFIYDKELRTLKTIFTILHVEEEIIDRLISDYSIQTVTPTTEIITRNSISTILTKQKKDGTGRADKGKNIKSITKFDDEILTLLVKTIDELKSANSIEVKMNE